MGFALDSYGQNHKTRPFSVLLPNQFCKERDDIYLEDTNGENLANPVPEPRALICLASVAVALACCLHRRRRPTRERPDDYPAAASDQPARQPKHRLPCRPRGLLALAVDAVGHAKVVTIPLQPPDRLAVTIRV